MMSSSAANVVAKTELQDKLNEYSEFIDCTLQPELKARVESRRIVEEEIDEYRDLKNKIEALQQQQQQDDQESLKALVNLGHETVYCQAVSSDTSVVYVHVGMGFHVEMTKQEAIDFCHQRIQFLETHVLTKRVKEATKVARHLEASMLILEQLSMELKKNAK